MTEIEDDWVCLIPVRNKTGIVDCMSVSEVDLEYMSQFKWCLDHGYATGNINGKMVRSHRVIMDLSGVKFNKNEVVDHIDNVRLNNMRSNLRSVSRSDNARNKKKKLNATSKYFGVYFSKSHHKFIAMYNNDSYGFENEEHAAFKYDLMVLAAKDVISKINGIAKPPDFIDYQKIPRKTPKSRAKTPIDSEKQIDGSYLIFFRNQKGEHFNTRVDAEDHEVIHKECYKLNNSYGYANFKIGRKSVNLHRWVMKVSSTEERVVDHINRDKSDNRKCNLRLVSIAENTLLKIQRLASLE